MTLVCVCCNLLGLQHSEGGSDERKRMRIEVIEWDDGNIEHATGHGVSVTEIEQAVAKATSGRRNKRGGSGDIRIDSTTDGGRRVVVIGAYDPTRGLFRPITAWEAE